MSEKLIRARRIKRWWLVVGAVALAAYLILHHVRFPLDFAAGWVSGVAWFQVFTLDGWIDGYKAHQRDAQRADTTPTPGGTNG